MFRSMLYSYLLFLKKFEIMILDEPTFENPPPNHPTHQWFFRSSIILLLMGVFLFLLKNKSSIDIQLHDTYLVVTVAPILITFSLILLLLGGIYYLISFVFEKRLNQLLSKIHYYFSSLTMAGFLISLWSFQNFFTVNPTYELFKMVKLIIVVFGGIFLIAQLLFLVNIILSFFSKKQN